MAPSSGHMHGYAPKSGRRSGIEAAARRRKTDPSTPFRDCSGAVKRNSCHHEATSSVLCYRYSRPVRPSPPCVPMTVSSSPWHLYVVRTVDGYLYAGVSTDVARRYEQHRAQGRLCARYLRAHRPSALVFTCPVGPRSLALKVEYRFKQLSRREKERVMQEGVLDFCPHCGRVRVPRGHAQAGTNSTTG